MTRWAIIAALGLLACALTSIASFNFGARWQRGQDAVAQVGNAKQALSDAQKQLADFGTTVQHAHAQFVRDADALHAIAEDYSHAQSTNETAAQALGRKLDAFLAQHPTAATCDIGPDGLRLWNAANDGTADATGSAGGDAGAVAGSKPAGAVPAAAAGIVWGIGVVVAQPPADRGAVPGLPRTPGAPGASGANAARAAGAPDLRPTAVAGAQP